MAGGKKGDAGSPSQTNSNLRPRASLFRKYFLFFLAAISTALVISGAFQILYGYRDQVAALNLIQQGQAEAAAQRIDQFVQEIEQQMAWTTQFPWVGAVEGDLFERRRSDAKLVLSRVPAISELGLIDPNGLERLRVSALRLDVVNSQIDLSEEPSFRAAKENGTYFGSVYYRRGSEPYFTLAVSGSQPSGGVSIAEVNLVFMWELISSIEVGDEGWAYVTDSEGRLIAHPDVTQVLRGTNYSDLPQVRMALTNIDDRTAVAVDQDGGPLISAHAAVSRLGWLVFIELPRAEALVPVYQSIIRTAGVMVLGLGLATLFGLILARRMVGPIRTIQRGAERIRDGELGHRIDVNTGDEVETLAREFNEMTARLQESLVGLEKRVEERTEEVEEKSQQLKLASEHKSEFLANMSHELRTPLNAILGYVELLLKKLYGEIPETAREVLVRVKVNSNHLLHLINDVLDLSKIEAGELELSMEDYDLTGIVQDAVSSTESLATEKGLRFEMKADAGLPTGLGDSRRLKQVALNLIGNAIKFTDEGFVKVTVESSGTSLELEVRDSGPGIEPAQQTYIFDEFQRADVTSTRSNGGTGLGLAISKKIVELHGGTIGVRSKPGSGSTFWVRLPTKGRPREGVA